MTDLDRWFIDQVLPLEAPLVRFLRRNWPDESEIVDLRQEVYTRVYDAARKAIPRQVKAFVFTTARNLLVDRARRGRIVSIEVVADLSALDLPGETLGPDRHVSGREELRRLQTALDALPPRCREVILLRKIECLPQREVAARMAISEDTVERQVLKGMRALAAALFGTAPQKARQRAKAPADVNMPDDDKQMDGHDDGR